MCGWLQKLFGENCCKEKKKEDESSKQSVNDVPSNAGPNSAIEEDSQLDVEPKEENK